MEASGIPVIGSSIAQNLKDEGGQNVSPLDKFQSKGPPKRPAGNFLGFPNT